MTVRPTIRPASLDVRIASQLAQQETKAALDSVAKLKAAIATEKKS